MMCVCVWCFSVMCDLFDVCVCDLWCSVVMCLMYVLCGVVCVICLLCVRGVCCSV